MSKLNSSFPDGLAGAALLMLRLSVALITWPASENILRNQAGWWAAALAAAVVALALAAGLWTRAASVTLLAAIGANLGLLGHEQLPAWIASAGGTAALALLGPGAYSLDAIRFGRKVIRLKPASPNRGASVSPHSGLRPDGQP